jgi:hypothetical protein
MFFPERLGQLGPDVRQVSEIGRGLHLLGQDGSRVWSSCHATNFVTKCRQRRQNGRSRGSFGNLKNTSSI